MPLAKPTATLLRSLNNKRARDEAGLFAVEGPKVVQELLAAGFPFKDIYATREWLSRMPPPQASSGPRVHLVTETEMKRISHYPTPSPVFAVGRIARKPVAAAELATGITLALDGIQDPGNVGTILRIADWFAIDRVLLSPQCADPWSPKVIGASMGSFARVRFHTAPLAELLAHGADSGVPVIGCDLEGDNVHSITPHPNAIVVVGSEGRGISAGVAAALTGRLTIPRYGATESLNAAIAAAIVCDNLRRMTAPNVSPA